ncbi:hypothetical protein Mapa_002907 [Marchantia paleacea]|nr:hypothetical protein Mapa_002907 [Marchantia paleacea]
MVVQQWREAVVQPFSRHYVSTCLQSAPPRKFLSIDCGGKDGQTDAIGIKWVTDSDFIKTGTNVHLGTNEIFPYYSARVFTEKRNKHCYVLPVVRNTTYLLRTIQYAGEASGATTIAFPVNFNVTVNNEVWYTFTGQTELDRGVYFYEAIFYSQEKEEVDICLVAGASGTPFVNSIEMRELNPLSYYEVQREGLHRFLVLATRYNTGSPPDAVILAYPDDPYDRYWLPTTNTSRQVVANSSVIAPFSETSSTAIGQNFAPERIRMDAWVGTDLSIQFTRPEGVTRAYAAWYFQEIRNVTAADLLRNPTQMIVGLNGRNLELNLSMVNPRQVTISIPVENFTYVDLILTSRNRSRPAILNGFELLWAYLVDESATNVKDANVLKALQLSFGLEDWTGDACYPVSWDWVTCDADSRIIELNLSDKNLTGPIPEAISELTQLQKIRLDNNSLSGSIPLSLRSLRDLQLLALDNNNLSGDIPPAFLDKAGFTFSGNPGICQVGGSCNSTAPISAPSEARKADEDSNDKIFIGVIVGLGVIIAVLVAGLVSCYLRGNRYKRRGAPVLT